MGQALTIKSYATLSSGGHMPLLGLGVWKIDEGEQTENAVSWALDAGYRHIDTAKLYGNETSVGRAVKSSKIPREEIWITTKLWPLDFSSPQKALEDSLNRLGLDYVDLYLIHWPNPVPIPGHEKKLWQGMEELVNLGITKAIGVSNYSKTRIAKILNFANIPPDVNQVRCSPFNYPKELDEFCKQNKIAFEAYSPLTHGNKLGDKKLQDIADKYNKTTAQVLIRWALQKNMIVIPKSKNKERIISNSKLYDFSLSNEDMTKLDLFSN